MIGPYSNNTGVLPHKDLTNTPDQINETRLENRCEMKCADQDLGASAHEPGSILWIVERC